MPFIVTEPQRIEGTSLGYSVYPYHFSFEDHFEKMRNYNQKIVVFKLKESEFVEVDCKVFESKFADYIVSRNHVENTLKEFVIAHPEYINDPKQVVSFFNRVSVCVDSVEQEKLARQNEKVVKNF